MKDLIDREKFEEAVSALKGAAQDFFDRLLERGRDILEMYEQATKGEREGGGDAPAEATRDDVDQPVEAKEEAPGGDAAEAEDAPHSQVDEPDGESAAAPSADTEDATVTADTEDATAAGNTEDATVAGGDEAPTFEDDPLAALEAAIRRAPGRKLSQIAPDLGVSWQALTRPVKQLIEEGRVRKEDGAYYPG